MMKLALALTLGLTIALAPHGQADAADVSTAPGQQARMSPLPAGCKDIEICGPKGCEWKRVCYKGCPDRYSCYSLYGAYQPYGGTPFWGAYTYSGWGGF